MAVSSLDTPHPRGGEEPGLGAATGGWPAQQTPTRGTPWSPAPVPGALRRSASRRPAGPLQSPTVSLWWPVMGTRLEQLFNFFQ